jgi:hypothetical protein
MRKLWPYETQRYLAVTLERQSYALDTLAFQLRVLGRSKDTFAATRRALRAQERSVTTYREISSVLAGRDRADLASSLDTLALRLRAAGDLQAAESATYQASEIRGLSTSVES